MTAPSMIVRTISYQTTRHICYTARSFSTATKTEQTDLPYRLKQELKAAMKSAQKERVSVIKSLLSEITYASKTTASADDITTESLLLKAVKKRMDSIAAFRAGGREDLAINEEKELQIIQGFLPKQLSREELCEIISKIVKKLELKSPKDIGLVMKEVAATIPAGSATKKSISDVAKDILGKI